MALFRLLACALLAVAAAAPLAAQRARPNVVIFLSDDQGWGDLSLHGNRNVRTPSLDSLGREGARFERFYVCPVCAPTRAEFLTGRYHPRTGVRSVSTGQERMDPDEKTLADAFRAAGYATGAFGKWHNGSQWPYHPNARGFDEYYGFTSGHWGEYFDAPLEHNGRPVRGRGYVTEDFTDRALEFIERNRQRPFLCYVPFNVPHSPYAVPREDWERLRNRPITMRGPEGENLEITRAALAMVENMDRHVGRLLQRLEDLRLAENTLVVFFHDNGPERPRWTGGLKGHKGSLDEGGVRSPLFLRWPGRIPAGTVVPEVAGAIDLLPTIAELAGVPLPAGVRLDGRSLAGPARGGGASGPGRVLFTHWAGRVTARTGRHLLDAQGALFDLASDPGQTRDVAAEQPDTAAALGRAVAAWRREVLSELPPRDERPFPVGYGGHRVTPLPARDGVPTGGVRRSAAAPNCSYFVNWTGPADAISWDVEVHTPGVYEVTVHYTCPPADAGSLVELSFGAGRCAGRVRPGWDPPLITDQDVIARPPVESVMKDFRPLRLGSLRLERGRGPLTIRAREIPGRTVMDLRQVTLTLR